MTRQFQQALKYTCLLYTSIADFAYNKHKFNNDMKMTKQEVKDEFKNTEGDPAIKGQQLSLIHIYIKEYKKFYEQVDPANAEILYKQVCEQLEQDDEIKDYAQTYSKMKPKEAAAIFDSMTDNLSLVAKILNAMDAQSRGNILGKMDSGCV